jgi:hypothetical protein
MTLETAVIGLLVAVAALINYYLSERAAAKRATNLEAARILRARQTEELAQSRAETLAAKTETHAAELAAVIGENTRLTQHAGERAEAAFVEANTVNQKIAALTNLGNAQVDALRDRQGVESGKDHQE